MDSLTNIALGAVIGEAQLGRKVGYKASIWGAALCTLPDLDVLLNPFLNSAMQLQMHRGFTHSFFFAFIAPPALGWIINRVQSKDNLGWKPWALLSFLSIFAHILIDIPTSYGTQALEPFSNQPLTTDSIFIIDPFFTTPLIVGLTVALLHQRGSKVRYWASRSGILVSGLYLIFGLAIKVHVNQVFDKSFKHQYGTYERLKTIPGPFTNLMWMGYVERNDSLYASTYSLFDENLGLDFKGIAKNSHILEPYRDDYPVEVLLRFSMGYYKMEKSGDDIYLHDLRFGRSDFWLGEETDYIWTNRFIFNADSTEVIDFDRDIPLLDTSVQNREQIWKRFWGETDS